MLTPTHLSINFIVYFIIIKTGVTQFNYFDLIFIASTELIDLDHLFASPIYDSRRNGFKTHHLHKKWRLLLLIAFVLLFWRKTLFLGLALYSHLLLDYIDVKIKKIE